MTDVTEVTCAVIFKENHVLVTQRSEKMPHPLKWEFPGGKVKVGETPETCIKREIEEELGIRIKVQQLLPSVKHHYEDRLIKLIPFVCSHLSGEVSLREHKDFRWVRIRDLKSIDWLEADLKIIERTDHLLNWQSW